MDENKLEIRFEMKSPNTLDQSQVNTMILAIRDINNIVCHYNKYDHDEEFNILLDTIITSAESLKI